MQGPVPTSAPPAPAAPSLPATPALPAQIIEAPSGASASAVFQALKAQRRELVGQLENLEDKRRELSERLQEPMVGGADRKGLEQRIAEVDQRISTVDKQIGESELMIAKAAAVPGAAVQPPPPRREGPPEEVFVLGGMFLIIVLLPLSIAFARRIWRRGVATVTSLPGELMERLARLEQGVDAVAVEVERIGEGQRYMARMFAEEGVPRAIAAGAAEPVEVKAREAQPHYRG